MTEKRDDDLHADFRALRAEAEAPGRVPDFDSMLARAHAEAEESPRLRVVDGGGDGRTPHTGTAGTKGRSRAATIGGWLSAATAAAAVTILLLGTPGTDADAEFERLVSSYAADASGGAWSSPTKVLLDIPGVDLGAVPSFGGSLRGLDPAAERNAPDGRES